MKALRWLDDNFERSLIIVLLGTMVAVVFLQVVMRYVFQNSLTWSEELARYCFIWMIYLGISYGVKMRRHIRVDVALLLIKNVRVKIAFTIFSNILFIVFCVFVVKYGSGIALQLLEYGQKAPALRFPIGLVYAAGPIGLGLTAIRLIQNMVVDIKAMIKGEPQVQTDVNSIFEVQENTQKM